MPLGMDPPIAGWFRRELPIKVDDKMPPYPHDLGKMDDEMG